VFTRIAIGIATVAAATLDESFPFATTKSSKRRRGKMGNRSNHTFETDPAEAGTLITTCTVDP